MLLYNESILQIYVRTIPIKEERTQKASLPWQCMNEKKVLQRKYQGAEILPHIMLHLPFQNSNNTTETKKLHDSTGINEPLTTKVTNIKFKSRCPLFYASPAGTRKGP
ncbi:hypothetical protein CW712_03915 [Candidatus Bathyarchaeota archaeon]|nr:MAG: hypothetical protein CW712_03915 [Candidatus Bathyarchaeota archaeon]